MSGTKTLYKTAIVIISDRASSGEREDKCIPVFEEAVIGSQFAISEIIIISDDPIEIEKTIRDLLSNDIDLILTSGGTGCSNRDNTPEVTSKFLDKPTPGVDEAIRKFSQTKAPFALFSRAVSGIAGTKYILNLPGSPKAVKEILEFILPLLIHPLKLIAGQIKDCQQELSGNDKIK